MEIFFLDLGTTDSFGGAFTEICTLLFRLSKYPAGTRYGFLFFIPASSGEISAISSGEETLFISPKPSASNRIRYNSKSAKSSNTRREHMGALKTPVFPKKGGFPIILLIFYLGFPSRQ